MDHGERVDAVDRFLQPPEAGPVERLGDETILTRWYEELSF
jgi:hypothetical protein